MRILLALLQQNDTFHSKFVAKIRIYRESFSHPIIFYLPGTKGERCPVMDKSAKDDK